MVEEETHICRTVSCSASSWLSPWFTNDPSISGRVFLSGPYRSATILFATLLSSAPSDMSCTWIIPHQQPSTLRICRFGHRQLTDPRQTHHLFQDRQRREPLKDRQHCCLVRDIPMQVFVMFQEPHGLTKCDRGDNIEGEELAQPRKVDRTEIGFGRGIVLADEFEEAGELVVDALFQVEVLFPGVLYSHTISLWRVETRVKRVGTPGTSLFRSSTWRSSLRSQKTWLRLWLKAVALYQSDRVYGERTALILRIICGSSVTRSLGPMRVRWPNCVNTLIYLRVFRWMYRTACRPRRHPSACGHAGCSASSITWTTLRPAVRGTGAAVDTIVAIV